MLYGYGQPQPFVEPQQNAESRARHPLGDFFARSFRTCRIKTRLEVFDERLGARQTGIGRPTRIDPNRNL
jgi:hypothetical protein